MSIAVHAPVVLVLSFALADSVASSSEPLAHALMSRDVGGTIWIEDLSGERVHTNDAARAERSFRPASTFKILNSLIALEEGAVEDEHDVIEWDGVERFVKSWNKDHHLRSAIQVSAVWFYQEVARRVGEEAMRARVEASGYGNRDIGGGIDRFWLDGDLRITPREQIAFLKRLHAGDLPFSKRSQDIVKDIMVVERGDGHVMRAKTGWALAGEGEEGPATGWYVGWVESGHETWFFATNIDIEKDADAKARVAATRDALLAVGALPDKTQER